MTAAVGIRRAIPNLITASRLLLVLPLMWALWNSRHSEPWRWATVGLFLVIASSDWLDGLLARRWSAETELGRVLDPTGDKLVALVCFVELTIVGRDPQAHFYALPIWLAALVVGKDLWMVVGYAVIRSWGFDIAVRPSRWGKASTALQLALAGSVLAGPELRWLHLPWLTGVLVWATAVLTVAAAAGYTATAVRRLATVQVVGPPATQ